MGIVLQGQVDLSNNFLPGITTLLNGPYELSTYYDEPPYMLAANTAWLLPNTGRPPLDDVAFRQALARAINTPEIVGVVYGNMVQAAHPTGLLPVWEQYVDQAVVDELGFSYDPDAARQILADAGYADTDGDEFVEMPDGSPIELTVIVPFGWSDWMEAARVISESAIAAGINLTVETPDYGAYLAQRNGGDFDTMVINDAQLSNTPYTYYNWMFMNPLEDIETIQNGNYGRFDSQTAFDLVDELDHTQIEDVDGMRAVLSELQRIHLTDMPIIPMWYNGMWSQVNESTWTNWPAAAEDANHWLPASWRGYWNMTGIKMLAELEPVPPAE
jgi:peptide/nickel transport system substrate-binding protein